jgi:hypothetical protein
MVTALVPPEVEGVTRLGLPKSTWEAVKPAGGTKKSKVLVALPYAVLTDTRPEVARSGTVVAMLVVVTAPIVATLTSLNVTRLSFEAG